MSLTFSSPRRPTKVVIITDKKDTNIDDKDISHKNNFRLSFGKEFSPLSNTTILGQLNQYIGSSRENDKGILEMRGRQKTSSPRQAPHTPQLSSAPFLSNQNNSLVHVQYQHLYVLPVLLLEFLAISLTRAVLPAMLIQQYGPQVYLILGCADCIRGILAFFSCPLFGKLSDLLGRKICLFVTVWGTCLPVCSLAFFTWDNKIHTTLQDETSAVISTQVPPLAIPVFIVLLSLSGIFSSTFTLVFAYISDSVQGSNERVTAYGLALATFGLSFTLGPMAGGYLANSNIDYVFQLALGLTILDLLYIYVILPESISPSISLFTKKDGGRECAASDSSSASISTTAMLTQVANSISWSPLDSIRLVMHDPFLRNVGQVAFFYYTGVWAVVSTLSIYAVQRFRMTPQMLGELMSALGLSTMVAEAILVRFLVPLVGEKRSIRIGCISFALQCLILGAANEIWHLFFCVGFSLLGNLVYPSLSSLVSGIVEPKAVGESLGAINGIKALTEGIGPLFFGTLMTISEKTTFPGSPYWLASILVFVAYHLADALPDSSQPSSQKCFQYLTSPTEEEYVHELEFKRRYARQNNSGTTTESDNNDCLSYIFPTRSRDDDDEEYQGLLSEVDEHSESWEKVEQTSTGISNSVLLNQEEMNIDFAKKPSV